MADALAKAAGRFEETPLCYNYDDDTIIWTDGAIINLDYAPAKADGDINHLSAAEILSTFYKPVVRNGTENVPGLTFADLRRLKIMETEMSLCDEIVFVTAPTDDSIRNVQAILAFFKPDAPYRHMMLHSLHDICTGEVMEGDGHTPTVERHLTDAAMRRVLKWDMELFLAREREYNMTPAADKLLEYLYNMESMEALQHTRKNADEEREYRPLTLLSLEDLQGIMWAKYNLYPFQLTDSLNLLYHEGLISAPFTHSRCSLPFTISSEGTSEKYSGNAFGPEASFVNAILPVGTIKKELTEVAYDPDKDECDTYKVAAMLYTYILNHTIAIVKEQETETVTICPYSDDRTVPFTSVLNSRELNYAVPCASEYFIEGRSMGTLMEQLSEKELIHLYGDSYRLSDKGITYLKSLKTKNKMTEKK